MFKEILNGYHDESFVYIIEGAAGPYASFVPVADITGNIYGEHDWDVCCGYVKDIKKATSVDDLLNLPPKQETNDQTQKDSISQPSQKK